MGTCGGPARVFGRDLALDVVPAALDADHARREVDVLPPQRLELAATQAGVERGRPERALVARAGPRAAPRPHGARSGLGRRADAGRLEAVHGLTVTSPRCERAAVDRAERQQRALHGARAHARRRRGGRRGPGRRCARGRRAVASPNAGGCGAAAPSRRRGPRSACTGRRSGCGSTPSRAPSSHDDRSLSDRSTDFGRPNLACGGARPAASCRHALAAAGRERLPQPLGHGCSTRSRDSVGRAVAPAASVRAASGLMPDFDAFSAISESSYRSRTSRASSRRRIPVQPSLQLTNRYAASCGRDYHPYLRRNVLRPEKSDHTPRARTRLFDVQRQPHPGSFRLRAHYITDGTFAPPTRHWHTRRRYTPPCSLPISLVAAVPSAVDVRLCRDPARHPILPPAL